MPQSFSERVSGMRFQATGDRDLRSCNKSVGTARPEPSLGAAAHVDRSAQMKKSGAYSQDQTTGSGSRCPVAPARSFERIVRGHRP